MLSTDTQGPTMKREQKFNILMNKKILKTTLSFIDQKYQILMFIEMNTDQEIEFCQFKWNEINPLLPS